LAAPFRVLSIDGGGIRGIVAARILVELESKLQSATGNPAARIADHFDLVAATSAGALLACFYLCPDLQDPARPRYNAGDALDLMFQRGPELFHAPLGHRVGTLGGVRDEKYPADGLEGVLSEVFEDVKLSALLRPCLVPAYDIQRRKAHFFKQHRAQEPGRDFLVRDLARGTSAAPTYFECARIRSDSGSVHALVDGGLVANNPAMCGYAEARKVFEKSAQDMLLLSVGTGAHKKPYSYYTAKDWGLVEWARPALDMFMSGVAETVDYQLAQIFDAAARPQAYLRIQAQLASEQADLDNTAPDNLEALLRAGETTARAHDAQLQAIARQLTQQTTQ